ncbi:hypothetical protein AUJ66_08175 [Candidatus Desantisbacteria bacterium CG1_02_38_46]|uniref:Uncharacterized protein n=1 Tax=Candidatus Desantisbacteria bacterium CG1_02_38_46 TaxID=1817893 RepID=A0A1J4S8R9_9BACT|nr:MAG: hypothetical protein AUJ66_08175 [Candidatus Desantisbacteria bacterium CG1_02_38_46]
MTLTMNEIKRFFKRKIIPENWKPTGLTKEIYVKLSEPIVRQAVAWQDEEGRIIDPFMKEETSTTTARFVGALGFLISAGRCLDLVDVCIKSMDKGCKDLYYSFKRPLPGPEFYVKELMRGYLALRDKAGKKLVRRWERYLGEYEPEKKYAAVFSKMKPENIRNFCTFALAGEEFKNSYKIADNIEFIEKYLRHTKKFFTEFGMYRDPGDPMTYDWVARMNLSLLKFFGYKGKNSKWLNEILKKGGLTTLFFLSSTGEAPYGGRSNQLHHNEATIALICEYEARRYNQIGEKEIAGAFKRAARLATLSIKKWLSLSPIRNIKNGFPPEIEHGRELSYGYYSAYSLLIASQLGFAYLVADDSIEEKPAPSEIGGYVLYLPDAFHKIFSTCCGYHLEIDTRGDQRYDATGLGRIHKSSIPSESGLSTSIVSNPNYRVCVKPSSRNIAIGPGWENARRERYWLSDFSKEIEEIKLKKIREEKEETEFNITYKGKFKDCTMVSETYKINTKGVEITYKINKNKILVQVPLLETDGLNKAKMEVGRKGFKVSYIGHTYDVKCIAPEDVNTFLEPFSAPNRNGIYKIGGFKTKGNQIKCNFSLH